MATKSTKSESLEPLHIIEVATGRATFCIRGTTPIILNRMSEKAKRQILFPSGKKNAAEKASTLKHNPLDEYRASPYLSHDPKAATRLLLPSTAIKGALRSVATDIPGAAKAQIGRLTYIEGDYVALYGVPQMMMSVTRSADMNHTPDVRTRAIVAEWACYATITFVTPILREQAVANLLAAAGIMRGVGDFRPEKGAGSYGQFTLVGEDDAKFAAIIKAGGRDAQSAALEDPEMYDDETAELYSWFNQETKRRGFKVVA